MILSTIGFTQKSAQRFFAFPRENNIERVVDIRLNPGYDIPGTIDHAAFSAQASCLDLGDRVIG